MTALNLNDPQRSASYLISVDILKGVAILSVLLLHVSERWFLYASLAPFHIWQAVPVFMLLIGFNAAHAASTRGFRRLKDMYQKEYLYRKMRRLLIPFLVVFVISGIPIFLHSPASLLNIFLIRLPIYGPGNYFMTMMFQFIWIFPLLYVLSKKTHLFLPLMFLVDLGWQIITQRMHFFQLHPYLYSSGVIRFLFIIALGIWLADNWPARKNNWWLFLGIGFSTVYLALAAYVAPESLVFSQDWVFQNLLAGFYPLGILLLFLVLFSNTDMRNSVVKIFVTLGRASYHIFLLQIAYFGVVSYQSWHEGMVLFIRGPMDVMFCIIAGLIFYQFDMKYLQGPRPLNQRVEV